MMCTEKVGMLRVAFDNEVKANSVALMPNFTLECMYQIAYLGRKRKLFRAAIFFSGRNPKVLQIVSFS